MGGDIKGGGLNIYTSGDYGNSAVIYGEGLRVPRTQAGLELDGNAALSVWGKKKSFDRVSFFFYEILNIQFFIT